MRNRSEQLLIGKGLAIAASNDEAVSCLEASRAVHGGDMGE